MSWSNVTGLKFAYGVDYDGWSNVDSVYYQEFTFENGMVVRVGDKHAGTCHGNAVEGVYVLPASEDVFTNDRQTVRDGDPLVYDCPEPGCSGQGVASDGSPSIVHVNGIPVHRVGDSTLYVSGSGQAITGSPDTFAG